MSSREEDLKLWDGAGDIVEQDEHEASNVDQMVENRRSNSIR